MPAVHIFSYPDPATEPLDYSILLTTHKDAGDAPTEDKIKKLNCLRSRMAKLLISQPNTKAILDIIDEYVPELIEILPFIEHNMLQNLIKIKWRSSLSASIRKSLSGEFEKPIIKSYSIYYEIIYTQMTYAFILSNMAIKKVNNDNSDDSLNSAISDLSKAAGIFQNLSISYASTWSVQDGPPETTSDSLAALANLALGDAQQLACLKAEKKNLSSGTMFKLKAGVVSKYDKCFKSLSSNKSCFDDLSRHFKSHIEHVMKLIEGSLLLTMAKVHAEKEEYGLAVAEITASYNMFVDCKEAENSTVKEAARDLISESGSLHTNFTKINNSVMYQKVPTFSIIRSEYLGDCRVIVEAKTVVFGKVKEDLISV